MNKQKKHLHMMCLCVLVALLCVSIIFVLTACGNTGDQHKHTYDSKWSKDALYHWHAATCEHTAEKADRAPHDFVNGVCSVCGYEDDSLPKTYKTVSFNLNGGESQISSMQFAVGRVMSDLPVPTRKGYKFISWQERYGDEYTAMSVMPDKDLYLIANWQKILTNYTDDFVSFKPATEGCKDESLYLQYAGEVDKFIYLEITSEDLGGADKVGENANFNLRTMEGMDYTVKPGYTWAWYQGNFNNPNGAQRFTLNYGSNIQFVTISDGTGVVRQTYLVDLYVLRDYYVSLYDNVFSTAPYERVHIVENEYFPSYYDTPQSKFDAADRVYYNSETGNYEKFIYSTPITKNWSLYQTYTYTATENTQIKLNLDGGTLEDSFTFSPYVTGYTLPVPVKQGYEFIGWKNSEGKFITDKDGKGGIKYLSEKIGTGSQKDAAAYVSDEITAVYETRYMYYIANSDGITTFKAMRNITYTDEYQTDIKSMFTLTAEDGYSAQGAKSAKVGDQVSFTATKAGHDFIGWYNGDKLLSENAEFTFTMTDENTVYTARYEAIEALKPFIVAATEDTVKIIGVNDPAITSLFLPACVTQIDEKAFNDCHNIESITVESGNANYNSTGNCIIGTENKELVLGCKNSAIPTDASVTSIGNYAFYKCAGLTDITIPDGVRYIGTSAFEGCTELTDINLGNGIRNIYNNAFSGCKGLTSITIPNSIQNIYSSAFSSCYHLVEVYNRSSLAITAGETGYGYVAYYAKYVYTSDQASKISTDTDGYVCFTDGNVKSLVNYVGSETNLVLPSDITEIHKYAFYERTDIVSVTIPNNVTVIGDYAFYGCQALTCVIIPDSVTSIGRAAFREAGLIHVTIGSNVESIGDYAFTSCYKLIEVYNRSSLNITTNSSNGYVANYAKHVYTQQGQSKLGITDDGYVVYTDGSRKILVAYMGDEKNLILPDGITEIHTYAFEKRSDIVSVTIPDSVTNIGNYAFAYCSGLTNIVIPDSVTRIGEGAFYYCSGLKSVTIGRGVSNISGSAFYYCSSLTSIIIPKNVTSIYSIAFSGCTSLETIYCEASSMPNGWSSSWYGNCTAQIVWGYEG